ncbi:hypothetical protein A1O3_08084 [Capronia epimyces CBS 606.96]|uniref:NADPH-dependent diflavin oxidoreductase 1 n=1 Tax=Capronia epimyces CBS 606.96 TaxID=1182542 RepID=W9YBR8_9EURO|nr:uncharacterized protein A1O3_08084 [Capronia epimyces CBS 606.96]EXJ79799.1 hypothetical protein A1O3_08084 [Capronia epimyces CBS 606.96]
MAASTEQAHGRSALILYGTETGTAQDFAEEIGRGLERLRFDTDVAGLDNVRHGHLHAYTFAVIVVSTTGQGDFPENARKFWTGLLRKKLSPTTLEGVRYALVGLGDSSYPKFNWAARKLDKRLRQLGATSILDSCEADEQGDEGSDGAFLEWLERFRKTVLDTFPLPAGLTVIPNEVLLPGKSRLEKAVTGSQSIETQSPRSDLDTTSANVSSGSFAAVLEKNERVTPSDHWQDVRFLRLKASGKIDYMPGDALAIGPRNMPEDVAFVIDRMNWRDVADTPVHLVSTRPKASPLLSNHPIFTRADLTLRTLLTEYLDINAIPRRSFFGAIANYTSDEMHKERLLEFTDPQYLDEYYDYATRPRRSMIEILQEFDSVHIPWEEATNIFPPLRPRQFSIASGGALKHAEHGSTTFELLVAIVKYRTVIKRIREGVCTRYLAQLPVGTTLQVSLKTEGRFFKSADIGDMSHVLVGAGTGVAPLRALIHEKAQHGQPRGGTALFFGCRNARADYFFHDEWAAMQTLTATPTPTPTRPQPQTQTPTATPTQTQTKTKTQTQTQTQTQAPEPDAPATAVGFQVMPAFSRDHKSKVYVQDRIREHAKLIWQYLRERDATIIVCGSSGAMPKAVRQALVDALVDQGQKRAVEGKTAAASHASASTSVDVDADVDVDDALDDDEDAEPIQTEADAEAYLARLEKEGRYKQETWS